MTVRQSETVLVVPSGIVFLGVCDIKGRNCKAADGGPITAVIIAEDSQQVNTCNACLHDRLAAGIWRIEGRSTTRTVPIFDIAVLTEAGQPIVVLEVKTSAERGERWIKRQLDQLRSQIEHLDGVGIVGLVTPHWMSLWSARRTGLEPEASAEVGPKLDDYARQQDFDLSSLEVSDPREYDEKPVSASRKHLLLERSLARYLRDVGKGASDIPWHQPNEVSEAFMKSLRTGNVVMECRLLSQSDAGRPEARHFNAP